MEQLFYQEREIFEEVDLCRKDGLLNRESIGWARNSVINCNLSGRWLRKKKWNYWYIMGSDCLFSVTVSNIDYAGMVFAYFYDRKTRRFIEKTVMTPFGIGCKMPCQVNKTVTFENSLLKVKILSEGTDTHIFFEDTDFKKEKIFGEFVIKPYNGQETLNVVIPWNERTFQFTSKQIGLPVEGTLTLGDKTYFFNSKDSFACLDFGRGVWPYKVNWNWASGCGKFNGRSVAVNLGAKWTDGTGMTENALFIDGKCIKLSENAVFEYDKNNFMKDWNLKTTISDRVNLVFSPEYERVAKSKMLFLESEVHQMIGVFNGYVKDETGQKISVENMSGCSEEHFGKW